MMPRPRGGEWLLGELEHLQKQGIDTLVSLLEKQEIKELALEAEESLCEQLGIHYINFPIKDRQPPTIFQESLNFVQTLYAYFQNGHSICVHCRMGIGRSAMISAALLIQEGTLNTTACLQLISEKRGLQVPDTDAQIHWLHLIQTHINPYTR